MWSAKYPIFAILLYPVLVLAGAAWIYFYGDIYAMRFEHFVPRDTVSTIYYLLFCVAQGENNRWMLARKRGIRGSSIRFGLFVDFTGTAALVFGFVWIISYGYDHGWPPAVGLYLFSWFVMTAAGIILSYIVVSIRRRFLPDHEWQLLMYDSKHAGVDSKHAGDWFVFWVVGTIGLWPLAFALMRKVSWFGFV